MVTCHIVGDDSDIVANYASIRGMTVKPSKFTLLFVSEMIFILNGELV